MIGFARLSLIDDKPDCFAIPDEFNIVRPCCERCENQLQCGLAIEQLGVAIFNNAISCADQLKGKIYVINRCLDYAHPRPKHKPLHIAPELMQVLGARVIEFETRRRSDEMASLLRPIPFESEVDDDYLDALLADLPGDGDDGEVRADSLKYSNIDDPREASTRTSELTQMATQPEELNQLDVKQFSPMQTPGAISGSVRVDVLHDVSQAKAISGTTNSVTPSELKYQFTFAPGRPYEHFSFNDLKAEWIANIERGFRAPSSAGYHVVREAVCTISIELNLRANWAPRFRDWPSQGSTSDRALLKLDRQVIDCHWLAVRYPDHEVANEEYEGILLNAPFDFGLASRFASTDWYWHTKAVYLNLTAEMEWELSAIQSEAVRKKWLRYREGDKCGAIVRAMGTKQIRAFLKNATKHTRLVSDWVNIWLAEKITGKNWAKTAALHTLMTGEAPLDRRQIAKTHGTILGKLKNKK